MVGWKVINQWTTKQHSATYRIPQQPSSTPISSEDTCNQSTISSLDRHGSGGDGRLPQQSACIVQKCSLSKTTRADVCPLNFSIGRLFMEICCCELSLARHTTTLAAMLSSTRRTLPYPILPQPPLRTASGRPVYSQNVVLTCFGAHRLAIECPSTASSSSFLSTGRHWAPSIE